ncbi:alpha/beta hydrolase [Rhizobium grahamii]|uniref:Alpha/beta hydrolase n=2 Tax=Rhizobium grahamii TaxID=1120045 RepID=A0A370KDP8_9HYPH|nr:alpha/beta hydrolase [Rhizobium grahamii]
MSQMFQKVTFTQNHSGTDLVISAIHREGEKAPLLFLHGFGSTKEDYADFVQLHALQGHSFLAIDAPGCGETYCSDLSKLSIPFLAETALRVADAAGFDRFHLVGHSMGGLTALVLAHQQPDRILSFVDIKGNLAPEDCFLSRQILDYPDADDERFFDDFIERTHSSPTFSSALYAATLRSKVRVEAVRPIFESMVDFSDNWDLLPKFLDLPMPKMFMFGEQYATLSYLPVLRANRVRLAEIPHCGHFPMYSNPPAMWDEIADFVATV